MQSAEQLAMVSIPWQQYGKLYPPADGLVYGTIFPCLNQPYTPISCLSGCPTLQGLPSSTQKKR